MSPSFLVLVDNHSAYRARFRVAYTLEGHRFEDDSRPFPPAVEKSALLPGDISDIELTVEMHNSTGRGNVLFSKAWKQPPAERVTFRLNGTANEPAWRELAS